MIVLMSKVTGPVWLEMVVHDVINCFFFFFFKQKTAYEIYQCDWSSDVCSSDLSRNWVKTNSFSWREAISSHNSASRANLPPWTGS